MIAPPINPIIYCAFSEAKSEDSPNQEINTIIMSEHEMPNARFAPALKP